MKTVSENLKEMTEILTKAYKNGDRFAIALVAKYGGIAAAAYANSRKI